MPNPRGAVDQLLACARTSLRLVGDRLAATVPELRQLLAGRNLVRIDDRHGAERAAAVVAMMRRYHGAIQILVVGAGDGAVVAAIHRRGYRNMKVVETSRKVIARMHRRFPAIRDIEVLPQPLGPALATMADDSIRLAIFDRTLRPVRRDDDPVLDELARVASACLVIEDTDAPDRTGTGWDLFEVLTQRSMRRLGCQPVQLDGKPSAETIQLFQRMARLPSLHEFWRQPAPEGNVPQSYIAPVGRSKALVHLIADLPKDAAILEVGCNVGRNLGYLYDQGWTNLQGIEISQHAVELLRTTYPQLADIPIHVGPAGEVLPKLPDDSLDLVFTMAVIEHIHPDEAGIFDEMVRISDQVLAIEPAARHTHRHFPHDVTRVFTSRGMKLVAEQVMGELPDWNDEWIGRYRWVGSRFARG